MLNAATLRDVFDSLNPFLPAAEPRTILAANANFPFEVFAQGLVAAACDSPLILQASRNALRTAGASLWQPGLAGERPCAGREAAAGALCAGARQLRFLVEEYVTLYAAPAVALALDHYQLPAFRKGEAAADPGAGESVLLREAAEACRAAGLSSAAADWDDYLAYLAGESYRRAKAELRQVVAVLQPAWVMVDSGGLPPVLAFAAARDIAGLLRECPSRPLLEAEFGGIGDLAADRGRDRDLAGLATAVAAFVEFCQADAIAYDIGMEHGAQPGSAHQPDEKRLRAVQHHLWEKTGRYVPFVQHGGTGAAYLVCGLVGKNNINTHFLVAAAQELLAIVGQQQDGIRAGRKGDCSPDIYLRLAAAVTQAAREKMAATGTLGQAAAILRAAGH